ncbi:hypothetical protein [Aquimarina sp. I32.4]|uniref:hypothetical protein n=1 Tax=Aquimarina sp. I32.4 TaxID=2053903 RepID=UPI000CDF106D|nr:hypothetical protein [Aquimarina sp. I32.4]
MKTYCIAIITICICSTACNSTKEFVNNDTLCNYDDPIFTITKDEMTFDVNKYDSILKFQNLIIESTNEYEKKYYRRQPIGSKEVTYSSKQTNKQTNKQKYIGYYPNGKIWYTRFSHSKYDIYFKEETVYDSQGNITKVIDHEKGYNICWEQAIAIVQHKLRHQLAKYDTVAYILYRSDLNESPNDPPIWSVGIKPIPDDKQSETVYYKIDGVTGKYLGKIKLVSNGGQILTIE